MGPEPAPSAAYVMIELRVLNGPAAGKTLTVRRFPYSIGRHPADHLHLEEPGVWERHLRLDLSPTDGVTVAVAPDAHARVNDQPVQAASLRNGDVLHVGAVSLRFTLAPSLQRNQRLREGLTWLALAALCAVQLALLYRL